ncbi:MAG: VOC family protein [Nocardioidaceae bacterium]
MSETGKIVVRPLRFTDNVVAMQEFLEILGLRPRIEAEGGGWVTMVAGGGMVALHSAASSTTGGLPGQTALAFEVDDVHAFAQQLQAAGVPDVTVYDETYGQVLECRDPLGDVLTVDSVTGDLYGYRVHPMAPPSSLRVSPVRFTDPQGDYGDFLHALGLTERPGSNESYASYAAAGGDHGLVGLHMMMGDDNPGVVPGKGAAKLNFESPEPVDELTRRLVDKGFDAKACRESFGSFVTVVDPDGQQVQVHEAPKV